MSFAYSQEVKLVAIEQIPLQQDQFVGVDKYDDLYSIDKNVLYKKTAKKTYQFSALSLGEITSVDILNPLKIILFYRDMNTVILLDDKLSEIERISFNNLPEIRSPKFITKANKNSLWLYNSDTQELEIFDYKTQKVSAHTQPVSAEIIDQQSNFNYCWLLSSGLIKRYNAYGSFVDEFSIPDASAIRFYNHYVLLRQENNMSLLDYKRGELYPLSIPEIELKDFYTANQNLYLYDGKTVYHYTLTFPN